MKTQCPHCRQDYEVSKNYESQKLECHNCGNSFVVALKLDRNRKIICGIIVSFVLIFITFIIYAQSGKVPDFYKDGSNSEVVCYVKEAMINPETFKVIENYNVFIPKTNKYIIAMQFQGNDEFGKIGKQTIYADIDASSNTFDKTPIFSYAKNMLLKKEFKNLMVSESVKK